MKFELTEEQSMIQQMTRDFADKELVPIAAETDEAGRFPAEAVAKLGELGLMGIAVSPDWGGSGMDHISYVIAMEEISRGCASTGVIMSVNNSLVCDPLEKFGTDEQKKAFLTPLASGQKLGCFALSEPETGSDAAAQRTTAVADGGGYVLNGTKNFITNGAQADTCIVFAMTDRSAGHRGITAFIVPMDTPGVSVGKVEKKLGIKGSSTTSIVFEDARLDASLVLGKVGKGFGVAMATLDGGRIGIAAQALGIARAAFEAAVLYSLERKAFGKTLAQIQTIQNMIADMATELDAARLLVRRAACLKTSGARYGTESAMAKLYASEMSHRVTHAAIQIFGGYGYCRDYPAERHYRDARITEIYEGTSEIQRLVIGTSVAKKFS